MKLPDTADERRALADRLEAGGHLTTPAWRAAVEAVPRELFLQPGVFLPTESSRWRPVVPSRVEPKEWVDIAYRDESLVTQLDGHLTADQVYEDEPGAPTSSSTIPATVVAMIEALDVEDGHTVLEIGTGTGYSAALMCHRLGDDNVTTIEVDIEVADRADIALEKAGFSAWTVIGDGLLGHPRRAPYDRVIATCAVRRVPYAWVRQTRPGGIILATVGSWAYGTGLAKLSVAEDGTAEGSIIGPSSFMPARSQAVAPIAGDLSARTAYADSARTTVINPDVLAEWMPAFLTQLAAPGAQLQRAVDHEGKAAAVYLFDVERESYAAITTDGDTWAVRQGGPVALWDDVERALTAWQRAGRPGIDSVRLRVNKHGHTYWIGGQHIAGGGRDRRRSSEPDLRWEHRVA